LREGEQTAGVIFSLNEKIKIAELLSDVNIDRIEAGFPFPPVYGFTGLQLLEGWAGSGHNR